MFCIIHGLNNTHRLISCINASIIHAVDTDASEPATAKGKHISDYLKQLFAVFHQCRTYSKTGHGRRSSKLH